MASDQALLVPELRRYNLLKPLIQYRVMSKLVADVILPPESTQAAFQQYRQQNGLHDDAAFVEHMRGLGLNEEDMRWQVELPLKLSTIANERFRAKAEAHFLTRKNQLDRVVYSLLRVRDRFLAQELYLRLEAGEASFPDLAAKHSEGPEQQANGIVGPVPLTQAHPLLSERLRISRPGELMEPFQIEEWWLVVRLESYSPASFDEATAEKMASELLHQWVLQETTLQLQQHLNGGELL